MSNTRIERDSMGELQVPAEALYGAQTQRAVNNFPISQQRLPTSSFVHCCWPKPLQPRPTFSWSN